MFQTLLSQNTPERKLILFFLKLFLIWLSWKGIIHVLGTESDPIPEAMFPALSAHWQNWNYTLAHFILQQSRSILDMMGYPAFVDHRRIWITGAGGIGMGNYCIGIQLIYYYTMLVLITPMSWTKKAIGIPVGIVITFVLNILRVASLCLIALYTPRYMAVAHDHIFNIIVFGALMIFYYYLIKERKKTAESHP